MPVPPPVMSAVLFLSFIRLVPGFGYRVSGWFRRIPSPNSEPELETSAATLDFGLIRPARGVRLVGDVGAENNRAVMPDRREQLDSIIRVVTPENIAFEYRVAGPF